MPLEINPSRKALDGNPGASAFVRALDAVDSQGPQLDHASVYIDFPIYRDAEGELVTPQLFLLSPRHGVLIVAMTATARGSEQELAPLASKVTEQLNHIYGRLLPSKVLPKKGTFLQVPVNAVVYAPMLRWPGDGMSVRPGCTADQALTDRLSQAASQRRGVRARSAARVHGIVGVRTVVNP